MEMYDRESAIEQIGGIGGENKLDFIVDALVPVIRKVERDWSIFTGPLLEGAENWSAINTAQNFWSLFPHYDVEDAFIQKTYSDDCDVDHLMRLSSEQLHDYAEHYVRCLPLFAKAENFGTSLSMMFAEFTIEEMIRLRLADTWSLVGEMLWRQLPEKHDAFELIKSVSLVWMNNQTGSVARFHDVGGRLREWHGKLIDDECGFSNAHEIIVRLFNGTDYIRRGIVEHYRQDLREFKEWLNERCDDENLLPDGRWMLRDEFMKECRGTAGVYALVDHRNIVIYVGQGVNVAARCTQHREKKPAAIYLMSLPKDKISQFETRLIHKYCPKYNVGQCNGVTYERELDMSYLIEEAA